jgi:hypothetical protein
MKTKLKPCGGCGKEIHKSATTCPHCGKKRSSAAGIILAVMIGAVVGWLMIARTCSDAAELDERVNEIEK